MRRTFAMVILAAAIASPALLPAPVMAQQPGYERADRDARERDRDYRRRCKKSKGTTGTIAGGVGGAVVGNAVGGGTLGTVAGGVGGALLGRHLDKKHDAAQNRDNGC